MIFSEKMVSEYEPSTVTGRCTLREAAGFLGCANYRHSKCSSIRLVNLCRVENLLELRILINRGR